MCPILRPMAKASVWLSRKAEQRGLPDKPTAAGARGGFCVQCGAALPQEATRFCASYGKPIAPAR